MKTKQFKSSRTIAVYARDEINSRDLHFVGFATTSQSSAEIAGKYLKPKIDQWRRTVKAHGCLIVEYYMPTIEEQAEWNGRPLGRLSEKEYELYVPEKANRAVFNRRKFRPRVQPHIAHREVAKNEVAKRVNYTT